MIQFILNSETIRRAKAAFEKELRDSCNLDHFTIIRAFSRGMDALAGKDKINEIKAGTRLRAKNGDTLMIVHHKGEYMVINLTCPTTACPDNIYCWLDLQRLQAALTNAGATVIEE